MKLITLLCRNFKTENMETTAEEIIDAYLEKVKDVPLNGLPIFTTQDCRILLEEYAKQFKYDYSKKCECGNGRIGETWCCNQCGLPVEKDSSDTLKLKFSPEVADVLGVWDANVLSIKEYERHSKKDNTLSLNEQIQRTGAYNVGFYEGFTSHAELTKKKEFTEEDLYNLMKMLRDTESRNMYEVFTRNFIQSLREFEVETFEIIGDTLTIIKLK